MQPTTTRTWLERSVWIGALAFLSWMAVNSFTTARSEGPSEAEARRHSSWILRFHGL